MDTNEKAAASRRIRRMLVALIFFAAALNYVDRQVLALLKPILQMEFSWDNQDFAHLGSVFQLPSRCRSLAGSSTASACAGAT